MQKKLIGIDFIKNFHKSTPTLPGVYRMFDENNNVLYVGKAKNLYNRIKNYTDFSNVSNRIKKMITETYNMEIITTNTENEALLLEQDFIKKLNPKYNILLKDDKTYSFLTISKDEIAKLGKFKGTKNSNNYFFGPFPSENSINETIKIIQSVFGIRTCKDTLLKNRRQPCILYQMKKCSGICCKKISLSEYKYQINNAINFLNGNNKEIIDKLSSKMQQASKIQDYETALIYRNKISAINQILKRNTLGNLTNNTDVIVIIEKENKYAIEVIISKNSVICGQFSFFPENTENMNLTDILSEFIDDFYTTHEKPNTILTNIQINNTLYNIETPQKGDKKKIIDTVINNAKLHLQTKLLKDTNNKQYMDELKKLFNLSTSPKRIDVFDNSHTFGTDKIGAMIVSGPTGFQKNNYRKYNIKSNIAGDDYQMMFEVLTRRYTRAKKEHTLPDLIIVDGGLGQLEIANKVINNLDLNTPIVGIAKGENRNAGEETLYQKGFEPLKLEKNNPILFYLQRIRDEAHRFAITTHRKKREKSHFKSVLDEIEGIGPIKRKNLLNYFESVKNIINSNISELIKVDGINYELAEKIYKNFH